MAQPNYLVEYEGYRLPGYTQNESLESSVRIDTTNAPFADGGLQEITGLSNKVISLRMKVWETDYQTAKEEIEKASTILKTKRHSTGILKIQDSDRYYQATPTAIRINKQAGSSPKLVDYTVDFSAKPWSISTQSYTISGSDLNGALKVFSSTGRTLDDGGWTYADALISGGNITISGYISGGERTCFVSVSGWIENMTINSESFTASTNAGETNQNRIIKTADYRLQLGPGETFFVVSGAQLIELTYHNRWYL